MRINSKVQDMTVADIRKALTAKLASLIGQIEEAALNGLQEKVDNRQRVLVKISDVLTRLPTK